jgi:hypothetical protein
MGIVVFRLPFSQNGFEPFPLLFLLGGLGRVIFWQRSWRFP